LVGVHPLTGKVELDELIDVTGADALVASA
jgi:hypothetical protein